MRCACIDVGSNTTALLVADVESGEITAVGTRRVFTMLGAEVGPTGIAEAKMAEVTDAVVELQGYARSLGCGEICLVGTHAVREAHNAHELEHKIDAATGLHMELIDGHEEARYSFIGATGGPSRLRGETVVIDAGGGSTEISHCAPGGEPVTASFAIGSATLQARCLEADPPSAEELAAARAYAEEQFAQIELPHPSVALAVGGGASTARHLTGGVIDHDGIARVLALVMRTPSAELAEKHNLAPNRARLLPAGLVILDALVARLGVGLEVGRGGLREGVLLDRYAAMS